MDTRLRTANRAGEVTQRDKCRAGDHVISTWEYIKNETFTDSVGICNFKINSKIKHHKTGALLTFPSGYLSKGQAMELREFCFKHGHCAECGILTNAKELLAAFKPVIGFDPDVLSTETQTILTLGDWIL